MACDALRSLLHSAAITWLKERLLGLSYTGGKSHLVADGTPEVREKELAQQTEITKPRGGITATGACVRLRTKPFALRAWTLAHFLAKTQRGDDKVVSLIAKIAAARGHGRA